MCQCLIVSFYLDEVVYMCVNMQSFFSLPTYTCYVGVFLCHCDAGKQGLGRCLGFGTSGCRNVTQSTDEAAIAEQSAGGRCAQFEHWAWSKNSQWLSRTQHELSAEDFDKVVVVSAVSPLLSGNLLDTLHIVILQQNRQMSKSLCLYGKFLLKLSYNPQPAWSVESREIVSY